MSPLKLFPKSVVYTLPTDLSKDQLASFPAYRTWIVALNKTLDAQTSPEHPYHKNPYKLRGITVQSVDRFGDRLGFIKFKADVRTDDDQIFPGSVFMRGGSVAMLLVLTPDSTGTDAETSDPDEFVILTVQPRLPAGTMTFVEIPAGMIDNNGTFSGAAAKEIKEETGLEVVESELIDMTELALSPQDDPDEVLQNAIYPSPGGSDEFIPIFLVRKTMPAEEIQNLQGKLTGLRECGEKISLKIAKLKDAWKVAGRDAKALSALCLYENLKREGKL